MPERRKATDNFLAEVLGEAAAETLGVLAEHFIVTFLFVLLIAGLVFFFLYVIRLIFGRVNPPLVPPNKHPQPIAARHHVPQLRSRPCSNS
jgi:hypothetical protein